MVRAESYNIRDMFSMCFLCISFSCLICFFHLYVFTRCMDVMFILCNEVNIEKSNFVKNNYSILKIKQYVIVA